jgi:hypothetical protein
MDQKTRKPEGSVDYEVVSDATKQTVIDFSEDISHMPNASSSLVTVEKMLPLNKLSPGKYTLKINLNDKLKNQTIKQSAAFTVTS